MAPSAVTSQSCASLSASICSADSLTNWGHVLAHFEYSAKTVLKPRIFEFNYVHTHLATNTITTPRLLFLGYLIHICQISERIIHVRLSFMDANWMSSFADKARTVRSIARVRDEAEGGRRATVSAVAADSC